MTTINQEAESSYFPSCWNKGHESYINHLPAKRTTLVSFPKTRKTLWDSEKVGANMRLHLSSARNVTVQIVEKTLRLAYQHAAQANSIHFNSFLVGSVEPVADEEGISVILNRFDPGRDLPGSQDRTLTAKLPGDFVAPICFSFQDGDQTLTHRETDFLSAFKYLEHSIGSRECVDLTSTLSLRIHCLCYEGTDDITLSLHLGAVTLATPIEMGPINSIPVIPTALARNLAGPISLSQLQKRHKFGLITMDQTRKLLLLLDTDPKAYALPLVGIWVSGVNYIHNPVILTACLKFLFSRSIQDRALTPTGGFLLLLYSPIHKHPLFYECKKGNQKEGMTFDLIGCKDKLHLYKHGDSSEISEVQLELTAARDGPSKELFLQTLKQFQSQMRPQKVDRKASLPEITADPHLMPRQSPKPTLTKSPTIIPSVPEVSLIFDDAENMTPTNKMHHSSPSYRRPGPLKDINQSVTLLEQRTAGLMTFNRQYFGSKRGENWFRHQDGMDENNVISTDGSLPFDGVRVGEVNQRAYSQKQCQRRESVKEVKTKVEEQSALDIEPLVMRHYHGSSSEKCQHGEQNMQKEFHNQQKGQSVLSGRRQSDGFREVEANRTFPLDHRQTDREMRHQQRFVLSNGVRQMETLNGLKEEGLPISTESHQEDGVMSNGQEEMQEPQLSQRQDNRHGFRQCMPERGTYPSDDCQHCLEKGQGQGFPDARQQPVQQKQHSPQQRNHATQQRQCSPRQSQHTVPQKQSSPIQSELTVQQQQHSPYKRQHSPQEIQHSIQKGQFSPWQDQFSPTQQIQEVSMKQNINGTIPKDAVREDREKAPSIHSTSVGEDSAFIQLKKQEKMIEALQEQIRYLLQLQSGASSPGLMTPPATPPSIPGHTSFPFPPSHATGESRQPLALMMPPLQARSSDAPYKATSGSTSHLGESVHPMGQGTCKQTATTSTNTGQSLFFHDQSDPHLPQDDGFRGKGNRANAHSHFAQTVSDRDSKGRNSTTDSSIQGSVSDSALSADAEFQLDLENTRDDTESLGKVELTSYPDSGSLKSSPDGSPTRHQRPWQSPASPSQSPGSGHNTTIVTPKMPTLVSPVLGESASTCHPSVHHHVGSSRTSPQRVADIPVISEEPNSEGTDSDRPDNRMQTPSLLQRDQRQFYQNLLGQVENFLQEEDESDGERRDEDSSLEDGGTSSSNDDTSADEDNEVGQLQTPRVADRSVLLKSIFYSPEFHPHINYISLAEMGMGLSDISVEADAIAMKYLSDEELAKISSDVKHNRIHEDSVNPLLRTVLTAGLSPRLANEKSMIKSKIDFSFATRKYLERHGLGETAIQNDGVHLEEDEGKVLRGNKDSKKKKRKRKILQQKSSNVAEVSLAVHKGARSGIRECVDTQEKPFEKPQHQETIGNILDWDKLKNLPKLF